MSQKKKKVKKRKPNSPLTSATPKKILCDMDDYLKQIVDQNARILQENQELYKEIKTHNNLCDLQLKNIKSDVTKLNDRVNSLERNIAMNAVNIFSIPTNESETIADLLKIYKKMGSFLKISPSEKDVNDIYRFAKDKKDIRIEFTSRIKKREFLSAVKNKEIKCSDIGFSSSDQIYVHEHLSQQNHKLYIAAKKLKKENVIQFVWTHNGVVLVRVAEGQKAIVIKSTMDLMKLG